MSLLTNLDLWRIAFILIYGLWKVRHTKGVLAGKEKTKPCEKYKNDFKVNINSTLQNNQDLEIHSLNVLLMFALSTTRCLFVCAWDLHGPYSPISISATAWLQHPHLPTVNMYSQVYILSGSPQKKAFDSTKAAHWRKRSEKKYSGWHPI